MVLQGRRGRSIQRLRRSLWWMMEVSRLGWYVLASAVHGGGPEHTFPRLGDRPNNCTRTSTTKYATLHVIGIGDLQHF